MRLDQREIYNRWCTASVAFPMNVAKAMYVKQLYEHRHNLRECLVEKLKLVQHAYEEGQRVV